MQFKIGYLRSVERHKAVASSFFTEFLRRIDHIYVRSTDKGAISVKNYKVNRDKYIMPDGESHYPSDHNPVVVDLTIK